MKTFGKKRKLISGEKPRRVWQTRHKQERETTRLETRRWNKLFSSLEQVATASLPLLGRREKVFRPSYFRFWSKFFPPSLRSTYRKRDEKLEIFAFPSLFSSRSALGAFSKEPRISLRYLSLLFAFFHSSSRIPFSRWFPLESCKKCLRGKRTSHLSGDKERWGGFSVLVAQSRERGIIIWEHFEPLWNSLEPLPKKARL